MDINDNSTMAKLAVDKSLLKEYKTNESNRVVYLNNDSEFQIQLFNPKQYTIGAEIYLNNSRISGTIVLKPGERVWLERYLDSNNKFRFSTYEVDGNDNEVKRAIENNGNVKIMFYKEKENCSIIKGFPYYELNTIACNPNTYLYNSYSGGTSDVKLRSSNIQSCTNLNFENNSISTSCENRLYSKSLSSSIETGRVEKGSYSNQQFNTVNKEFEYFAFNTEEIKILPTSRKQFNTNDLQKIYCTNCGRKLNSKYKYCPYCGNKCD